MEPNDSTPFADYVRESIFEDDPDYNTAGDIAQYGADTGVPGLIYTCELRDLFHEHAAEIVAILAEQANDTGISLGDLLTKRHGREPATDPDTIATYAVWAAVELLAYRYTGEQENA